MAWATWVLLAAQFYIAAGAIFAVAFLAKGIRSLDAAARGAPWTFHLLVTPGIIALWPILALKWAKSPAHRVGAHE